MWIWDTLDLFHGNDLDMVHMTPKPYKFSRKLKQEWNGGCGYVPMGGHYCFGDKVQPGKITLVGLQLTNLCLI